jgi:hypothetical protein
VFLKFFPPILRLFSVVKVGLCGLRVLRLRLVAAFITWL